MTSLNLWLFFGVSLMILIGLVWLILVRGFNKIRHQKEWRTAGSSGERSIYLTLIREIGVPKNQIFRNVYVPTKNGGTSEIDLLVVSKKGLLVFECKNYGGNIYGDAKMKKWLQYLGHKKSYFYNPLMQNLRHAKNLRLFLGRDAIDVPIIPIVATIARGNWQVRNLGPQDFLLGYNCHLEHILKRLSPSPAMAKHYHAIMKRLAPLSRPHMAIRQAHAKQAKRVQKTQKRTHR